MSDVSLSIESSAHNRRRWRRLIVGVTTKGLVVVAIVALVAATVLRFVDFAEPIRLGSLDIGGKQYSASIASDRLYLSKFTSSPGRSVAEQEWLRPWDPKLFAMRDGHRREAIIRHDEADSFQPFGISKSERAYGIKFRRLSDVILLGSALVLLLPSSRRVLREWWSLIILGSAFKPDTDTNERRFPVSPPTRR
jgi:hypothetical protein